MVRTLDMRSWGRWFDSRSGRYQVVTAWTGDCLRTGKPSWITNTMVNSAFHPSGVGKSSNGLYGWGYGGVHSPVLGSRTLCDPIWWVMPHNSEMGFPWRAMPFNHLTVAICQTSRALSDWDRHSFLWVYNSLAYMTPAIIQDKRHYAYGIQFRILGQLLVC